MSPDRDHPGAPPPAAPQEAGPAPQDRPPCRHLPGVNARPDDRLLERWAALAPPVTDPGRAHANPAWRYGLQLLADGYYWEAHELLEPVWYNAAPNSRHRLLVQGVIQLANACLKAELGRHKAAMRLAAIARVHFVDAAAAGPGTVMGIDPAVALAVVDALERDIGAGADWRPALGAGIVSLIMHYNSHAGTMDE